VSKQILVTLDPVDESIFDLARAAADGEQRGIRPKGTPKLSDQDVVRWALAVAAVAGRRRDS